MIKRIFLLSGLCVMTKANLWSQTNVSGGITSNTTWSLSASPYVVTGNITVFPGYTLNIEPGVVVKFDAGTMLEIRQSSLIAWGNSNDSIIFTSNSSQSAGSWSMVQLNGGTMTSKFNYCSFRYATTGLYDNRTGSGDTLILKNSNFLYNTTGFYGIGTGVGCGFIDTCNFRHNTTGASNGMGSTYRYCDFSYNQGGGCNYSKLNTFNNCTFTHNNTGLGSLNGSTLNSCIVKKNLSGIVIANQSVIINNCAIDSNSTVGIDISKVATISSSVIRYNGTGINDHNGSSFACTIDHNIISNNATGLKLTLAGETITCNSICNNTTYDLDYLGTNNVDVTHNYWCTADSASTEAVIHDGYDNITYGLATFMPIDASCSFTTSINLHEDLAFKIYPNPAADEIHISFPSEAHTRIALYNMMGELQQQVYSHKNVRMDISSLSVGMYLVLIERSGEVVQRKLVKN